jgi:hypothetical protein
MRSPTLLLPVLLAACASPGAGVDPAWNQIQRERLERLRTAREPMAVVTELLGHEPAPLWPQEPEPAVATRTATAAPASARPYARPPDSLRVRTTAGFGDVAFDASGTPLDDRTDAAFVQLGVDSPSGVGLYLEAWGSGDDLFQGVHINDGISPAAGDASFRGLQVFPHIRHDLVRELDWSMPLRIGLFSDYQRLYHERANVERQWTSVGSRLLLEPTWRVYGDDGAWIELVGRVGGDVGATWFEEEFIGGSDSDAVLRLTGEIGASLRGNIGRMEAELGYALRQTTLGESDTELLGRSRVDARQQQLFFGLGVRF